MLLSEEDTVVTIQTLNHAYLFLSNNLERVPNIVKGSSKRNKRR
jgi:hypothetical protein